MTTGSRPAFWDIQINGRWGHSFSSPELTVEQVAAIVRAQGLLGTARLCPTLITAPPGHLLHGVRTIAAACDADPGVGPRVLGIHLEGPFLSRARWLSRGASGRCHSRSRLGPVPELQDASGGRIVLLTLAPERPGAIGVHPPGPAGAASSIALGHTAADGPTIQAAVEAGARLSTHLGNGIAVDAAAPSQPDLAPGGSTSTLCVVHRRRPPSRPAPRCACWRAPRDRSG